MGGTRSCPMILVNTSRIRGKCVPPINLPLTVSTFMVSFYMAGQITRLSELLLAEGALVRLFAIVHSLMTGEMAGLRERFAAHRT